MSINIFTLLAQIINFLVLFYILQKILYQPLLKIIEERKQNIREKIDNAENKLQDAQELKSGLQKEISLLNDNKENEKNKIISELSEFKEEELKKIKLDFEKEKESFKKQFLEEQDKILENVVKKVCNNLDDFLSNIFKSLSTQDLQETIFNTFLKELGNLSEINIKKIQNLNNCDILFMSSYDLDEDEQNLVINLFRHKNINNKIIFSKNDDLFLGNKIIIDSIIINSNVENVINQFMVNLKQIM